VKSSLPGFKLARGVAGTVAYPRSWDLSSTDGLDHVDLDSGYVSVAQLEWDIWCGAAFGALSGDFMRWGALKS
jgi:hypothetical protein